MRFITEHQHKSKEKKAEVPAFLGLGDLHSVASANSVREVTEVYLLEGRGHRPPIIQWKTCQGHTGEQATA